MNRVGERRQGIGLALSGGGYRAALFHVGALWRLNELGWLPRLNIITSVSGGSLPAALLGLRWSALEFDPTTGVARNFEPLIAAPIQEFCTATIDLPVIARAIAMPWKSAGNHLAAAYDRRLFHGATLQDLPARDRGPRFTIYATSLQSGVSVRLTKDYVADYRVGRWLDPDLSLALAVAASSAFPPLLSPVVIAVDPARWTKADGADLYDDVRYRRCLYLTDGGVYDNMGLEAIRDRCETVLVSDAGAPYPTIANPWRQRISRVSQLKRVFDTVDRQNRAVRRRWLVEGLTRGEAKGCYWGIATNIDEYARHNRDLRPMVAMCERTRALSGLRTRLNRFDSREQGELINWGYALADAAMRCHVLTEPAAPTAPGRWPVPAHGL